MIHTRVSLPDPAAVAARLAAAGPELAAACAARPWVRAAWLVGSYATGEADRLSDIDFLVLAAKEPGWREQYRLCEALAAAALRLLGVGPVRSRFDVPRLAWERGLVPPRTAWAVWRAGIIHYSGARTWDGRAEEEARQLALGAGWRFADWAWCLRAAAERAALERRPEGGDGRGAAAG